MAVGVAAMPGVGVLVELLEDEQAVDTATNTSSMVSTEFMVSKGGLERAGFAVTLMVAATLSKN